MGALQLATIEDIAKRYGYTTVQGMTGYVKKHLSEINTDGEHAKLVDGKWSLDAIAIKRLDKLKEFNRPEVLAQVENDQIRDLTRINQNLQVQLLNAQSKLTETQEKLITAQEKLLETGKSHDTENTELRVKLEMAENRILEAETKAQNIEEQTRLLTEKNQELHKSLLTSWNRITTLKSRNIFSRLFNFEK